MAISDDKQAQRVKRELEKLAAHDEAEISQEIQGLLSRPSGQKFLWWLLQIGKVYQQPYQQDSDYTIFQCGELNVGNQMLARFIETNAVGYAEMQLARKLEDERRNDYATRIASGDDLYGTSAEPEPGTDG